jgi:hypothetical protein
MKLARSLFAGSAVVASIVVIGVILFSSVLSRCVYSETKRTFSPDGMFYAQVQATI